MGCILFKYFYSQTQLFHYHSQHSPLDYATIENFVPGHGMINQNNTSETHLGQALMKLLPEWEPYEPGTLLIAVTYNMLSTPNTEEELIVCKEAVLWPYIYYHYYFLFGWCLVVTFCLAFCG